MEERVMLSVAEIMTTNVQTLGPDDSLAEARKLMAEHHIRHIPIVEDGDRLAGLVTQRDVLAAADSSLIVSPEEASKQENYIALSSFMIRDVQTVDQHASLRGTAMHLQKNKMGCLPVVEGEILVGIVTDSDFVTVAITLMEQMEETEPEESDLLDETG
jgi:CBS domain-containing protein